MKKLVFCIAVTLIWAVTLSAEKLYAENKAAAGFERLKSLVGEWEALTKDGDITTISYRLISNGSVLLEESNVKGKPDHTMYTMYHLDGDNLMLTHYCAAGNQPRMRGQIESPNVIKFSFLDATNLASPNAGHMRRVLIKLVDNDHMTEEWTFRKDGKDAFTEMFQYMRKK